MTLPRPPVGWGGGIAFGVSISAPSAPRLSGPQHKFMATPMTGALPPDSYPLGRPPELKIMATPCIVQYGYRIIYYCIVLHTLYNRLLEAAIPHNRDRRLIQQLLLNEASWRPACNQLNYWRVPIDRQADLCRRQ